MGVLKDALEAMLATTQDGSARSGVSGKTPLVPLADLYNLFRSRGIAVLGASTTAFAVYDCRRAFNFDHLCALNFDQV
ncbi:MAG: hypothetical protein JNJ95_04290 [Dechloromonas sp.]|nr:hypothetical protein [Dechloromonas sp.]